MHSHISFRCCWSQSKPDGLVEQFSLEPAAWQLIVHATLWCRAVMLWCKILNLQSLKRSLKCAGYVGVR